MQWLNVLCSHDRIHSASQGSFQLDGNLITGRKDLLFLREMQDGALEKIGLKGFLEAVLYFLPKHGKGTCSSHCVSASLSLSLPICKMRLSLLMFGWCFEIPRSKQIITAIIVPSIIVMC